MSKVIYALMNRRKEGTATGVGEEEEEGEGRKGWRIRGKGNVVGG